MQEKKHIVCPEGKQWNNFPKSWDNFPNFFLQNLNFRMRGGTSTDQSKKEDLKLSISPSSTILVLKTVI